MKTIPIKRKISSLEANLELIKRRLGSKPDFLIDESNWEKIKPTIKKIRQSAYRKNYGR